MCTSNHADVSNVLQICHVVGFCISLLKEQWLLSLINMLSVALTGANSNFLNVQCFPSQDC